MRRHDHDATRILKCSDTADFLAALPRIAGFTATDSIFVVLFTGKQARSAVRLDLPDEDRPADSVAVLDLICRLVRELGGDEPAAPAIVITCERTFAEEGGAPWRRLARRIERRLRREGLAPRDLCCLAPDGWVSYLEPEPPALGHPLQEIADSPVAREARELGAAVPDLSELGALPRPDLRRKRAVAGALEGLQPYEEPAIDPVEAESLRRRAAKDPRIGRGAAWAPEDFRWLEETVTVGRAMIDGRDRLSPRMTARLLRTVERPDRWFVLAVGLITRPEFPLEMSRDTGPLHLARIPVESEVITARGRSTLETGSIHRFLASVCHEFTEYWKLAGIREMLLTAISEAPDQLRPGAFALSAWVWWMCGSQSVAERHVREALALDPAHELALMLQNLVKAPACAARFDSTSGRLVA